MLNGKGILMMLILVLGLPWPSSTSIGEEIPSSAKNHLEWLTLKGTVTELNFCFGHGPGSIGFKTGKDEIKTIRLGSTRYLFQKGFNLSVGTELEVRGVQIESTGTVPTILAVEIKNLSNKMTLRLRDEQLKPLWAMGCRGCGKYRE